LQLVVYLCVIRAYCSNINRERKVINESCFYGKDRGLEVLRLKKTSDPSIGNPGEILARIKAAAVNPIDAKQRKRGTVFKAEPPLILGCDCAGVVQETGSGVKKFRVGEEVFFMHGGIGREPGTYAECMVIDERFAARKPEGASFEEAGAAPLPFITAWESLFERGGLEEGQTVLIHGGAGGVGHIAVQLAAQKGTRVCTTVSNQEKKDFVTGLGAERAILYKDEEFVEAVLDWTDGKGVDLALEMVGGETFFKTFSCVKMYGRLVTLLAPKGESWGEARMRNISLGFTVVLSPMFYGISDLKEHHAALLETCAKMMDNGTLRIHVSRTFPLEKAAEAHRVVEEGHTKGKIVLTVE
jgi:NADPH2:quinone reductase